MAATYPDFDTMPLAGTWRAGRSGDARADTDPWSGDTLTEIALADASDLDEAFTAAATAQADWAARAPAERAAVLRAAADVMQARREEIVGWLVQESGGTLAKAELEWGLVHANMLEAASLPHHVEGRIMPSDVAGKESRVYRRPVGVVAVISPWNFPCSCPTARSPQRSRWATRSCSSRPATPRSPAGCCSPGSTRRPGCRPAC